MHLALALRKMCSQLFAFLLLLLTAFVTGRSTPPELDEDCELNSVDTMVSLDPWMDLEQYRNERCENQNNYSKQIELESQTMKSSYKMMIGYNFLLQHDFCCDLHDESPQFSDCQMEWHEKIPYETDEEEQTYMFVSSVEERKQVPN